MKKLAPILIVLSVALNVAFALTWALHAFSRHRGTGGSRACRGKEKCTLSRLHRALGVTEKQRKKIEPCLNEFRKASGKVCHGVYRLRLEMIDLLAAPDVSRDTLQAKQDEILEKQREMQGLVIEYILSEKEALTENQRAKLFELLKQTTRCPGHGVLGAAGSRPGKGACPDYGTVEGPQ